MVPQTQVSLDTVFKIVGLFLGIITFLTGVIIAAVKMFHSDLKKSVEKGSDRLDELIRKLEPITADVIQLKVEIVNIKEDHKELKDFVHEQAKWVGQHDTDIQSINRILKSP